MINNLHFPTSTSNVHQPLSVQRLMRLSLYIFIFCLSLIIFALSISNIVKFKDDILTMYFDPTFALLFAGVIGVFVVFPAHLCLHRQNHQLSESTPTSQLASVIAELLYLFPGWAITLGGVAALSVRVASEQECISIICTRSKSLESIAWISFGFQTILAISVINITSREGRRGVKNVWTTPFGHARELEMREKMLQARESDMESVSEAATIVNEKLSSKLAV